MDNRPLVVLLSKLSFHGETLHEALQNVCKVKWIARKSEFRADPLRFPLTLFREFLRLLATCRIVPGLRGPIIVVHSIGPDAIPALAVRRITNCKIMLYAVGSDVLGERKLLQKSYLRWAVRNADVVLCGNAKIEAVVRNFGARATRILPTPFVPFELGVDREREFDVVSVGSLTDGAKQSLLIEASEFLDPSVRIAIIGEGPQRQYLTELSRGHGRNQVSFLGELPPRRLHHTLHNSGIYVRCSPSEGTSSSVLEAACCGLPIIEVNGGQDSELTELFGLVPIVPDDRRATSLAMTIQTTMENSSALLADISRNREALESYSKSWPNMAMVALFS